ncbi:MULTISPECIES: GspH/FimT family pseudopilin [Deefgea]|uniref:Type II secretion system protein H n=1 Tax=Deefgea chitinilytica TaxID=570276 RepID=A0ABS2C9G8_9NEIS|nr:MULTISPECIES: GspH/FimT family pseudopilin [Deefgea]MBM5570295.1 prepilin-type N-terminal cleavage/methylation domain-containing protein [Deefgea chitinilytica]MBM9887524.1 GspH/FimT family pseudopilin [Deefgea sp. CFH1-16]
MSPFKNHGFTLIELLITIAILGIVLAIAIPNFNDFLEKKRLDGAANEYLAILQFAKSEALKRNTAIHIIATRVSASDWRITAATASTCAVGDACDLKTFSSATANSILTESAMTGISGTTIEPVRLLPSFTSTQSVLFSTNNYSIRADWTVTGLTSLCIPTGAVSFGGHPAC